MLVIGGSTGLTALEIGSKSGKKDKQVSIAGAVNNLSSHIAFIQKS
jgi:hypothetical protein